MRLLNTIFLIFVLFNNLSFADDGIKFNNLVVEFHDNESYPFLEERNDIGIF